MSAFWVYKPCASGGPNHAAQSDAGWSPDLTSGACANPAGRPRRATSSHTCRGRGSPCLRVTRLSRGVSACSWCRRGQWLARGRSGRRSEARAPARQARPPLARALIPASLQKSENLRSPQVSMTVCVLYKLKANNPEHLSRKASHLREFNLT